MTTLSVRTEQSSVRQAGFEQHSSFCIMWCSIFLDATLKMWTYLICSWLAKISAWLTCLHLPDATASSTKNKVYVCTNGYFTLQRSQPHHTVDISIGSEQMSFAKVKDDEIQNKQRIITAYCFTEVTLTYAGSSRAKLLFSTIMNNSAIFRFLLLKSLAGYMSKVSHVSGVPQCHAVSLHLTG